MPMVGKKKFSYTKSGMKKAMLAEYTLVSKNEKASGAVFDLTTS